MHAVYERGRGLQRHAKYMKLSCVNWGFDSPDEGGANMLPLENEEQLLEELPLGCSAGSYA